MWLRNMTKYENKLSRNGYQQIGFHFLVIYLNHTIDNINCMVLYFQIAKMCHEISSGAANDKTLLMLTSWVSNL